LLTLGFWGGLIGSCFLKTGTILQMAVLFGALLLMLDIVEPVDQLRESYRFQRGKYG